MHKYGVVITRRKEQVVISNVQCVQQFVKCT